MGLIYLKNKSFNILTENLVTGGDYNTSQVPLYKLTIEATITPISWNFYSVKKSIFVEKFYFFFLSEKGSSSEN